MIKASLLGGLLLPALCFGQTFTGIKLPTSGQQFLRTTSSSTLATTIDSTLLVGTKILPETVSHEWNTILSIENYSHVGDNAAFYAKADKYGNGPTFGGVIEVQDVSGIGPIWGLEVDVMTRPDRNQGNRFGIGLVLGKQAQTGQQAYVDWGMLVVPWGFDRSAAQVGYGMAVLADCRYACFMMHSNQRFQWDSGGEIHTRFDAETGFWQMLYRGTPMFEFQMQTGEFRIKGKTVNVN